MGSSADRLTCVPIWYLPSGLAPRGAATDAEKGTQSLNFKRRAWWSTFLHESWPLEALAVPKGCPKWCPGRASRLLLAQHWTPGAP